jgi:sec-independent protein translocase protein TatA
VLAEIFGIDGVVLLIVVAAVLFGSSRIPKLARSLGSAQAEFKRGQLHGDSDGAPAAAAVHSPTSSSTPGAVVPPSSNGSVATPPPVG